MDLSPILLELHSEKARIEQAIALLEGLQRDYFERHQQVGPIKHRSRSGRESMDPEERTGGPEVASRPDDSK